MSITSLATLNAYLINTTSELTFIQIIKPGVNKIDNINNIILATNYTNTIVDVSNTEIYNYYKSDNYGPLLLLQIKYLNNSPIGIIPIYTITTTYDIIVFIHSKLKTPTTIVELDRYLKYTKYDTTLIRIFQNTQIISKQYIINILEDYNTIAKSNYEYFEISTKEIIDYYKIKIKSIPSILIFKKPFYYTTGLIPCKYLSGENYYTEKTINQLKLFLKYGLK